MVKKKQRKPLAKVNHIIPHPVFFRIIFGLELPPGAFLKPLGGADFDISPGRNGAKATASRGWFQRRMV